MVISMITLTVRHTKKDSLKSLISAMEKAYQNLQGTHAFKDLRNSYNAKFVRVTEVTYGKNGFHPHFHVAVIHDKGVKFSSYSSELENTWIKHIEKNGLFAPKAGVAMDITENADNDQRAWYLTKASGGMSLEISNGRNKRAMGENMSIWQVHGHAVNGSLDALKVWSQYESEIKGKRLISPSRGLEAFFGIKWKGEAEAVGDEFSGTSLSDEYGSIDETVRQFDHKVDSYGNSGDQIESHSSDGGDVVYSSDAQNHSQIPITRNEREG